MNRGPSAYQPNALPLDQTGSLCELLSATLGDTGVHRHKTLSCLIMFQMSLSVPEMYIDIYMATETVSRFGLAVRR